MLQLELFPETKEEKQEREFNNIKESWEKTRKKLYAENNALRKELKEVRKDLDLLTSHLCKGLLC